MNIIRHSILNSLFIQEISALIPPKHLSRSDCKMLEASAKITTDYELSNCISSQMLFLQPISGDRTAFREIFQTPCSTFQ